MIQKNSAFIVLFSGGFDSYVTTEYIIQNYNPKYVKLLNIHYGQVNMIELHAAKNLFNHLKEKYLDINIEFQKFIIPKELTEQLFNSSALVNKNIEQTDFNKNTQPTTYVPFRNLMFLTFASIIAENQNIPYIATGIQPHTEYYYWDATEDFILRLNGLISLNPKNITIIAPFKNKTKNVIYKIAKNELKLSDVELSKTWSCYNPKIDNADVINNNKIVVTYTQCNKCGSCLERNKLGIPKSNEIKIETEISINRDI